MSDQNIVRAKALFSKARRLTETLQALNGIANQEAYRHRGFSLFNYGINVNIGKDIALDILSHAMELHKSEIANCIHEAERLLNLGR